MCKHCGAVMDGEVDHVSEDRQGNRSLVEAKAGADFNPAKDAAETERNIAQMQRYTQMASGGGAGVMYKLPKGHDKAARQIAQTAKQLGITPPQTAFI